MKEKNFKVINDDRIATFRTWCPFEGQTATAPVIFRNSWFGTGIGVEKPDALWVQDQAPAFNDMQCRYSSMKEVEHYMDVVQHMQSAEGSMTESYHLIFHQGNRVFDVELPLKAKSSASHALAMFWFRVKRLFGVKCECPSPYCDGMVDVRKI